MNTSGEVSKNCKQGKHPQFVFLIHDGAGVQEPFCGWVCKCGARIPWFLIPVPEENNAEDQG